MQTSDLVCFLHYCWTRHYNTRFACITDRWSKLLSSNRTTQTRHLFGRRHTFILPSCTLVTDNQCRPSVSHVVGGVTCRANNDRKRLRAVRLMYTSAHTHVVDTIVAGFRRTSVSTKVACYPARKYISCASAAQVGKALRRAGCHHGKVGNTDGSLVLAPAWSGMRFVLIS